MDILSAGRGSARRHGPDSTYILVVLPTFCAPWTTSIAS